MHSLRFEELYIKIDREKAKSSLSGKYHTQETDGQ